MKDCPVFNNGDKVIINKKYSDLEKMRGAIYTVIAGPQNIGGTWCYWLENVRGAIAADALDFFEETNEAWFCRQTTERKADKLTDFAYWLYPEHPSVEMRENVKQKILNWLKGKHEE